MAFNLEPTASRSKDVRRNLPPAKLYERRHPRRDPDCDHRRTGALIAYSGDKTGRSPKDKRVVQHPNSEKDVWWGPVNIPLDEHTFADQPRARASTTSTPASACTASTASPAGTRSTASRSA